MAFLSLPVDISKFRFYEKKTATLFSRMRRIETLYGLEIVKGNIHRSVGLNQFESKATLIPKGFKLGKRPSPGWIESWVYDPSRKPVFKNDPRVKAIRVKHKGWKSYLIHSNGGSPIPCVHQRPKCRGLQTT